MTTIELKSSITADLENMSVEMLENVSRYVKRLRHRTRNVRQQSNIIENRREAAMQFVKNLSITGGATVPNDEPLTPILQKYIKTILNTMFINVVNIRKYNGVLLSPKARIKPDKKLNATIITTPKHKICRKSFVS